MVCFSFGFGLGIFVLFFSPHSDLSGLFCFIYTPGLTNSTCLLSLGLSLLSHSDLATISGCEGRVPLFWQGATRMLISVRIYLRTVEMSHKREQSEIFTEPGTSNFFYHILLHCY